MWVKVDCSAYMAHCTRQIKLVAIDTISNYIRYPDIKQSEKMSVMSSLKKTINKLNTEMAVKVGVCVSRAIKVKLN